MADLALFVVQIDIRDATVAQAFADGLGFAPGATPNRIVCHDDIQCAWLGPGEWLLSSDAPVMSGTVARVRAALADHLALILDFTSCMTIFTLNAPEAIDALASHCPLNLSNRTFPAGSCARTLLGDTDIFIGRYSDEASFRVIAERSLHDHVAHLLALPA